jgi:exodeoxyribonuclease VII large subunit
MEEYEHIHNYKKNKIIEIKKNTEEIDKNEINLDNIQNDINKILYQIKEDTIYGEIISFRMSDVNSYITIKTNERQIKGIFWKIKYEKKFNEYQNLKDGDKIKIQGKFNIMKKDLSIYFNINNIEKEGIGEYMNIYYEYRKKIIENEWDKNKRRIKKIPLIIGIVTSLEGAAIEDILKTFENDNFKGEIIIKNAVVQGKSCANSVIEGIKYFENIRSDIDILLITRGGGSYEDLVGFSSWNLIEKVHYTNLLTMSAVGHQVDNQLTDEVSDYKCATPSIGAKLIIETQNKYLKNIIKFKEMINKVEENYIEGKKALEKITENYDKILAKYNLQEMNDKHKKYSKIYNLIIDEYNESKLLFMKKMSIIKPSLFREDNELFSLRDIVDVNKNKTVKPNEIIIKFIDGFVKMTYKVIEYNMSKNKITT